MHRPDRPLKTCQVFFFGACMSIIEEVVTKLDDWKGRDVSIQHLSGGLTNTNYKVIVDGIPFWTALNFSTSCCIFFWRPSAILDKIWIRAWKLFNSYKKGNDFDWMTNSRRRPSSQCSMTCSPSGGQFQHKIYLPSFQQRMKWRY